MERNQLKKLNRQEILELLLEQVRENELLREELAQAQEELARKELIFKERGSLAEASLELVDIFKKADEAAELYLASIKKQDSKEDR